MARFFGQPYENIPPPGHRIVTRRPVGYEERIPSQPILPILGRRRREEALRQQVDATNRAFSDGLHQGRQEGTEEAERRERYAHDAGFRAGRNVAGSPISTPVRQPAQPSELDVRRAQSREQLDRQTRDHERSANSAWTKSKLRRVALMEGGSARNVKKARGQQVEYVQYVNPTNANIETNRDRIKPGTLEDAPAIIDEANDTTNHDLETDLNYVIKKIESEHYVIDDTEMMQNIDKHGQYYLLGLIINQYIFKQDFTIDIHEGKITLIDNQPVPSLERREKKSEFEKTLSTMLAKFGTLPAVEELRNILAVGTFHNPDTKMNLGGRKQELETLVGINASTNPTERAQLILDSTAISTSDKSFLLAYQGAGSTEKLNSLSESQTKFVLKAQEYFRDTSPEELLQQGHDNPGKFLWKKLASLDPLGGFSLAVVLPLLLFFPPNTFIGKMLIGLTAGAFVLTGGVRRTVEGAGGLLHDTNENVLGRAGETIGKKFELMMQSLNANFPRISKGPSAWMTLLMRNVKHTELMQYSAGAILCAFSESSEGASIVSPQDKLAFSSYKTHPDYPNVSGILAGLTPNDRIDIYGFIQTLYKATEAKEPQKINLDKRAGANHGALKAQDLVNNLPNFDGYPEWPWRNSVDSTALRVILTHIDIWRTTKISDIISYYELEGPGGTTMLPADKPGFESARGLSGATPGSQRDKDIKRLKEFFKKLYDGRAMLNPNQTLTDVMETQTVT